MNKSKDKYIIEYICAKYNITQSELAKRTGVTRQRISNIVAGGGSISRNMYDRLMDLFPDDIHEDNLTIPDDITNEFLTELRKYYRMSKVQLAKKLNVSTSLLSLIEKKEKNVSKALKNKIRMLYSSDEFNAPKNVFLSHSNELPDDLTNRSDTKVITIDKSVKYLVIKIDDVK